MTELPHYTEYDTRLGSYAVITREADGVLQLLVALWNETTPPRWTLPGGGVEMDETIEAGVVREVMEETGFEVELGELLSVETAVFSGHTRNNPANQHRPLKVVRVLHRAHITGGDLRSEVDGTTDEARWIALDELEKLPHVAIVDSALRHLRRP